MLNTQAVVTPIIMPIVDDDPSPGAFFLWHASSLFSRDPLCGNPEGEETVSVTSDLSAVDCPFCCRHLRK